MYFMNDKIVSENRKDEVVKDGIILQAQKLFRQFGLKKTTMDEIASASGKAKSTLYHYFKSKDEVFDAVVNKEHNSLRKVVASEVNKQNTTRGKLQKYFVTFHQETVNKINLYWILKGQLNVELSNRDRFNNIIKIETKFLSGIIGKGIDNQELNGIDKKQAPWFSELLVIAFLGIVKHSVTKDNVIDIDELYKVSDLILTRLIN